MLVNVLRGWTRVHPFFLLSIRGGLGIGGLMGGVKSIRRDPYYVVLIDFGEFQPENTGSTILENNLK